MKVIGVDIGTSGMKLAIYEGDPSSSDDSEGIVTKPEIRKIAEYSESYPVHIYNDGTFGEVNPDDWRLAFQHGCSSLEEQIAEVEVLALSGTTPALMPIRADGEALQPAILMLDGRSHAQVDRIIQTVGSERLLQVTGNLPAPGGCSLASMLWIKEHRPELFKKTRLFGHSNTWFGGWLTGRYAIDPSSASLTGFYNTVVNDLSWNREILAEFGLTERIIPRVIPSNGVIGEVKEELARRLGLKRRPLVVIGGNDAVLASFSAGVERPGQALDVNGTAEIGLVCLDSCICSANYNVRAHVIPDRWLTLYVMNAGGKALAWFHREFCRELSEEAFYNDYLPESVNRWLEAESTVAYEPFLLGSRYSRTPKQAAFSGITEQTSRSQMLAAVVRGLYGYQREHLKEIALSVPLLEPHYLTGGAISGPLVAAKKKWMRSCTYEIVDQSSARGAALLALQPNTTRKEELYELR